MEKEIKINQAPSPTPKNQLRTALVVLTYGEDKGGAGSFQFCIEISKNCRCLLQFDNLIIFI